ncbi:MAG: hypothetical protein ACI35Z_15560 [Sphingobacterium hotanense]
MKVKELIAKLQEKNPEAEISVITVGSGNQWEYTSDPKVTSHKNIFGETVWIQ